LVFKTLEKDGSLHSLAWCSNSMLQTLKQYGEVSIIDTTYNKNRWDLPLGLLIVKDSEGRLRIGSCALLGNEDTETFTWWFQYLINECYWYPKVVMSDGDLAIGLSIENLDTKVTHLLCLYHIMQNIHKNLGKVLGKFYLSQADLDRNSRMTFSAAVTKIQFLNLKVPGMNCFRNTPKHNLIWKNL